MAWSTGVHTVAAMRLPPPRLDLSTNQWVDGSQPCYKQVPVYEEGKTSQPMTAVVHFPPLIVQWVYARESMMPIAETLRRERVSAQPDRGLKIAAYEVRLAASSGRNNQKFPGIIHSMYRDARMMASLLLTYLMKSWLLHPPCQYIFLAILHCIRTAPGKYRGYACSSCQGNKSIRIIS